MGSVGFASAAGEVADAAVDQVHWEQKHAMRDLWMTHWAGSHSSVAGRKAVGCTDSVLVETCRGETGMERHCEEPEKVCCSD